MAEDLYFGPCLKLTSFQALDIGAASEGSEGQKSINRYSSWTKINKKVQRLRW